jgi:hypothetical protein
LPGSNEEKVSVDIGAVPPPATPTPPTASAVTVATPDPAASKNIKFIADNVGTGLWQFEKNGSWGQSATAIWNNGLKTGDNVTMKFKGTGVTLGAEMAPYGGIVDICILDSNGAVVSGSEVTKDLYNSLDVFPANVYEKKDLPLGEYTLKISKHDGKNPLNTTQYEEACLVWADVYGFESVATPDPTASKNIQFIAANEGTGLWQFAKNGCWGQSPCGLWNNGLKTGDNVTMKFKGTGVTLGAEMAPYGGIVDICILDSNGAVVSGSEVTKDLYCAEDVFPANVYEKKDLTLGEYTLKISKHEGKNPLNTTQYEEACLVWADVYGFVQ